jgi:hypothetical protein
MQLFATPSFCTHLAGRLVAAGQTIDPLSDELLRKGVRGLYRFRFSRECCPSWGRPKTPPRFFCNSLIRILSHTICSQAPVNRTAEPRHRFARSAFDGRRELPHRLAEWTNKRLVLIIARARVQYLIGRQSTEERLPMRWCLRLVLGVPDHDWTDEIELGTVVPAQAPDELQDGSRSGQG